MTCIEAATYAESVISTPSWEIGEPIGPMQNGTTYMTRPAMQPANSSAKVARIRAGAIQLLVGPASSSCSEQMNVRSSTRATSEGSDDAAKLPGRSSGLSRVSVPRSTSRPVRSCHSRCEPSHQWTAAGPGQRGDLRHPRDQPAMPGRGLTQPRDLLRHAVSFPLLLRRPGRCLCHSRHRPAAGHSTGYHRQAATRPSYLPPRRYLPAASLAANTLTAASAIPGRARGQPGPKT